MAKAPVIKFPRIQAGFYSVTQDGELRGYIMKEVTEDKETNWFVFDNSTPEMDIAMLNPEDAIDAPDELFREAKESAKRYFLDNPMETVAAVVEALPKAEWNEATASDEDLDGGDWEENTIVLEMDDDGVEFELVDDEDFDVISEEEMIFA